MGRCESELGTCSNGKPHRESCGRELAGSHRDFKVRPTNLQEVRSIWVVLVLVVVFLTLQPNVNTITRDDDFNAAPAAEAVATQSAWNQLVQIGAAVLEQQLETIVIPDFRADIGSVHLNVSAIACKGLVIHGAIGEMTESGFTASSRQLRVQCTAAWQFTNSAWPYIPHGSGTTTAKARAAGTVAVSVDIGKDGKPVFKTGKSHVEVDARVRFQHSKWADLMNKFSDMVSLFLSDEINKAVETAIRGLVDQQFNDLIAHKFFTQQPLPVFEESAALDLRFGTVRFFGRRVYADNAVAVVDMRTGQAYLHHRKLDAPESEAMVAATIDLSYLADSLADIYMKYGYLSYRGTPENIPDEARFLLRTSTMRWIAPELYHQYADADMEIEVAATAKPTAVGNAQGQVLLRATDVRLAFYVRGTSNTSSSEVLVLGANVSAVVGPSVMNATDDTPLYLGLEVRDLDLELALIESLVGTVHVSMLRVVLGGLCRHVIPSIVNTQFKRLVAVPVAGVSVPRLDTRVGASGILHVELDVDFTKEDPPTNGTCV